jgi:hypothetical protein
VTRVQDLVNRIQGLIKRVQGLVTRVQGLVSRVQGSVNRVQGVVLTRQKRPRRRRHWILAPVLFGVFSEVLNGGVRAWTVYGPEDSLACNVLGFWGLGFRDKCLESGTRSLCRRAQDFAASIIGFRMVPAGKWHKAFQ